MAYLQFDPDEDEWWADAGTGLEGPFDCKAKAQERLLELKIQREVQEWMTTRE